jgi:hypothetical protein
MENDARKEGIRGWVKWHVLGDEANRRSARYSQLMKLEYKTSGARKGRAMPQPAYWRSQEWLCAESSVKVCCERHQKIARHRRHEMTY